MYFSWVIVGRRMCPHHGNIVSHKHCHVPWWHDVTNINPFWNTTIPVNQTVLKGLRLSRTFCPVLIGGTKLNPPPLRNIQTELSGKPHACTTVTLIQKHIWEADTQFPAILFLSELRHFSSSKVYSMRKIIRGISCLKLILTDITS